MRKKRKKHKSFPKKIGIDTSNIVQKQDVVKSILDLYGGITPIHQHGIEMLYDRAENRGHELPAIFDGLITCITKNYLRALYTPPNNDPMCEVIDERRYIEDWEFRAIFK